jgi:two-component system, response regulator PdtaR
MNGCWLYSSSRVGTEGFAVTRGCLAERLILVVEDEPLIALDVQMALCEAGATVVAASYVETALFSTEHPDLSAAVVDIRLGDGSGTTVCHRLRHLGVPFLMHTAYPPADFATYWPDVPIIKKPAGLGQIVATLQGLLSHVAVVPPSIG